MHEELQRNFFNNSFSSYRNFSGFEPFLFLGIPVFL